MADPISLGMTYFLADGFALSGLVEGIGAGLAEMSFGAMLETGAGLLGAGSALFEHGAADDTTAYNERIAAEQYADQAVETEQAMRQQERAGELRRGSAYAAIAAGGGDSASAFDLLADNASQEATDLLTIKRTGAAAQNKIKADAAMSSKKTSPSILGTGAKVLTSLVGMK